MAWRGETEQVQLMLPGVVALCTVRFTVSVSIGHGLGSGGGAAR